MTTETTTETEPVVPDWLLPDRAYDILKWLALIVLPALAVFVQAIFPVWGIPYGDAVATTLTAIAALIGVTIGVSEIKARIK